MGAWWERGGSVVTPNFSVVRTNLGVERLNFSVVRYPPRFTLICHKKSKVRVSAWLGRVKQTLAAFLVQSAVDTRWSGWQRLLRTFACGASNQRSRKLLFKAQYLLTCSCKPAKLWRQLHGDRDHPNGARGCGQPAHRPGRDHRRRHGMLACRDLYLYLL